MSDCKVYVGDLSSSATRDDLEDAFSYYGKLKSVWVARNPPGFGFIEFEDSRDAEDAVRGLDGRTICGRRARVELSNGKSRSDGRRGGGGGGGGYNGGYRGPSRGRGSGRPFSPSDRCYECGERGHYARDCSIRNGGGGGGGRRNNNRYNRRSRSPRRRSYSRSASRDRSRSPRRSASRDRSGSRNMSRSPANDYNDKRSRSRSRSASF